MAEPPQHIPSGAEDGANDVLGKLDELLNRHKPKPRDPQAQPVPVLTDALPEDEASRIPTLTDIVSRPDPPSRDTAAPNGLAGALVQRLAMRLEVERARMLGEAGGESTRAGILDELIRRLRESLPDIVQVAISREQRKAARRSPEPGPEDENR